jgi:hypothetical protein
MTEPAEEYQVVPTPPGVSTNQKMVKTDLAEMDAVGAPPAALPFRTLVIPGEILAKSNTPQCPMNTKSKAPS